MSDFSSAFPAFLAPGLTLTYHRLKSAFFLPQKRRSESSGGETAAQTPASNTWARGWCQTGLGGAVPNKAGHNTSGPSSPGSSVPDCRHAGATPPSPEAPPRAQRPPARPKGSPQPGVRRGWPAARPRGRRADRPDIGSSRPRSAMESSNPCELQARLQGVGPPPTSPDATRQPRS